MNRRILGLPLLMLLLDAAVAQEQKPPAQSPDPAELVKEVMQQFKDEGIVLDGKAKTVTIDAVVNQPPDPIEYLLIHRRGKMHEAMFFTQSKPSVLNAALLMLGMQPGKNASYEEKTPPPTLEEIEKGADPIIVHPPSGQQIWMTVKWEGKDGKQVEYCVDDLILNLRTEKPLRDAKWFYLGGRMAQIYKNEPPVFVADMEGNLASTCYMIPENHLVTVAHADARNDGCWWLTDKCPEPGTKVKFVFHRDKPNLYVQREARLAKEPPDAPVAPPKEEPPPAPENSGGGNKGGEKKGGEPPASGGVIKGG